ncbi:hypothetical protein CFK38_05150 [Brachybacterium vulturis]|uniref:Uncharacterized protein n=1 Tax=Brachybacterium vulturis TaxID=2017484 RepID=A0A291GLS5_9MICO|nr:hypothetical protein [Brachybacterium vulturis]ATG50986.1 hypothetical protein CFK38_05150 [Brachybacterium vulturis]
MYGWLFRRLPGPLWARILLTVLLVAMLIVALFAWVFPAIAPHVPVDDSLVGAALSRSSSGA